jgi:trigger factor
MSATVESLEGLKRRMMVEIPADKVGQTFQDKLLKIASTAKVDGFRPGKVPLDVVQQRFGKSIMEEVAQELIQTSFHEAVQEHGLALAGMPDVAPEQLLVGQSLKYTAEFEVYPDIKLVEMVGATVTRHKAEVSDKNVADMIANLRKQQAEWTEADRAAQDGDQVIIDFDGFMGEEAFEGGAAKDFQLELGSKQMIPGFEEGVIGFKAGESTEVKVTFPEEYQAKELAGKEANFKVTVKTVKEPKLPEITEEFAKKVGVEGGVDALESKVKGSMEEEVGRVLKARLKQQVLDNLLEFHTIDVPESLIKMEIENLQQVTKRQMAGKFDEEQLKSLELPTEPYEKEALKRVQLGLLLGEVIRSNEMKAGDDKIREEVESIAASYPNPEQVVNWYYQNEQMLKEVEAGIVEAQAVDKLLETLTIEEAVISYDEAIKQPEPDADEEGIA